MRRSPTALGISVRTVAKWVARARQPTAWRTARRARIGSRAGLPRPRRRAIVALRRTRATAWQISAALGMPRSTVTRVLARVGLNRVALLEPAPLVQRYEWPHVGDLLHLDLKRLGRVTGIGHRIHGDRRRRGRGRSAGNICMSRSMTRRDSPMPKCSRPHDAPTCAAFLSERSRGFAGAASACADCSPTTRWPIVRRRPRGRLSALAGPPPLHAPLSPADQWQSRAVYPDAAARMGVSACPIAARPGAPPRSRPYLRFYNHRRPHASLGRRSPWMRFQEAA